MKEKNKKAWAKTANAKSFGVQDMFVFTWPRIWDEDPAAKVNVVLYFVLVILVKAFRVVMPLILKLIVD